MLSAMVIVGGVVQACLVSRTSRAQETQDLRLTVRPHAATTATRTERSGTFELAGVMVDVPPQCVGARRCPLVLYSNDLPALLTPMGHTHGFITARIDNVLRRRAALDSALAVILHTLAIDPDKIAIIGGSATGERTADLAAANPNVFSRVLLYTQHTGAPQHRGATQTTEYYISGGLLECVATLRAIQHLRDLGYPVTYTLQFRPHGHTVEDHDAMGHWLQEAWATSNPAQQPAPANLGSPSLLTVHAIQQLTEFWGWFMQQPDSVRTVARRAHEREVALAVGDVQVATLMTDMSALAAQFPTVAAEFKAIGLTPQQHDAYRAALASVHIVGTNWAVQEWVPLPETSTVARNLAFMYAHPDAFRALNATGMWSTP
jgi:hypothetical protein